MLARPAFTSQGDKTDSARVGVIAFHTGCSGAFGRDF